MTIKDLLLQIDEFMTSNDMDLDTNVKIKTNIDDIDIEWQGDEIQLSFDTDKNNLDIKLPGLSLSEQI